MTNARPVLHFFCGKIAAGKSTLASKLVAADAAVLMSEDDWLSGLYSGQMKTANDYIGCVEKLRAVLEPHIVALLHAGTSVVLDFQANTVESRRWLRGILDQVQADHQLHVLVPPDAVCLARLRARNARGDHPFSVTEEQFHQFARHFAPPSPSEGFNLVFHDQPPVC